jgi:hypothetical protein
MMTTGQGTGMTPLNKNQPPRSRRHCKDNL